MLSYWERTALLEKDCIIVGSGIAGLLTAIELARKFPNREITVLERGILPIGATSRNAGFACFGSLSELYNDLQTQGENATLTLLEQRYQGLQKLLQITGKKSIQYQHYGGYELIDEKHLTAYENLPLINQKLFPLFRQNVFYVVDERIAALGLNRKKIKHLIFNPLEGQIHSGLLIKKLKTLACQRKVEILTGAKVTRIEPNGALEQVVVEGEEWRKPLVFQAKQVVICNNAFVSNLIPELKVQPARGQIIVTEEVPRLKLKGTFHYDQGFIYFRNVGKRVLLGGARNLFLEQENTEVPCTSEEVLQYLQNFLREWILEGQSVKITDSWAGIMGFGDTKLPIVQSIRDTLHVAVKFSGMGVALAANVAESIAQKIKL